MDPGATMRTLLERASLCLAFLIAGCGFFKPAVPDYRYRLTVEVDTPQGVRTGSSVIRVASNVASKFASSPGKVTNQIKGEAVAVDLPGGRVLIALLSRPNSVAGARYYAFDALLGRQWDGPQDYVSRLQSLVQQQHAGVLPRIAYPELLTFRDIQNPASAKAIDPEDLERDFGQGVRLRRITVQITGEEFTTVIERKLPWLHALSRGGTLGGQGPLNYENPALNYGYIDFKREL